MRRRFGRCSWQVVAGFLVGFVIGILIERSFHSYTELDKAPRISCIVILRKNHCRHLEAIRRTWLPYCTNHLIVHPQRKAGRSTVQFRCENTTLVTANSGWDYLCQSFHLLRKPTDWLIIVPDSLHVIFSNLKKFLRDQNSKSSQYFGHPIRHYAGNYNVLTAGVVLSNATIEVLRSKYPDVNSCKNGGHGWNNEDRILGEILQRSGVTLSDTRDGFGRSRFHGYNVNTLLSQGKIFRRTDYFKKAMFPIKEGIECCSQDLVTIDSSDAEHQLIENFLIDLMNMQRRPTKKEKPRKEEKPKWEQALRDIGYEGPTDNITSEQYFKIWEKHVSPEEFNKRMRETIS